jgi:hypothetical protein
MVKDEHVVYMRFLPMDARDLLIEEWIYVDVWWSYLMNILFRPMVIWVSMGGMLITINEFTFWRSKGLNFIRLAERGAIRLCTLMASTLSDGKWTLSTNVPTLMASFFSLHWWLALLTLMPSLLSLHWWHALSLYPMKINLFQVSHTLFHIVHLCSENKWTILGIDSHLSRHPIHLLWSF